MVFYGVDAVAIRADRGESVTTCDSLPVDAGHKCLLDLGMALAAGGGHVEFIDGRLLVVGRNDLVSAVAVSAHGGLFRAVLDSASMHAFLIGEERLCRFAVGFHEELLAVAAPARGRNVRVADRRFGIIRRDDLVRFTMAVLAGRRDGRSGLGRLGMEAMRVCRHCVGVAIGTGDFFGGGLVYESLHIFVTIDAGEHAAVYGVFELATVHEQADLFAIYFIAQGGVGVAGEAVLVGGFLLGRDRGSPKKQG